ncbi:MAG TPA: DUF1501 domain-containing protein [Bryobacteraceae bacterium]|nr:DUF1501 domain-containing protein [Bryobacteraceae bacterium]
MRFHQLKTRRDFIRYGCGAISTIGAAAAFGQAGIVNARAQSASSDYKALVCVFLLGGNDANNMLIPNDAPTYKQYQTIRGNLAIAQGNLVSIHDPGTNANYGLHPSMAGLGALYTASNPRLALVANVGTLVQPVPHDPVTKLPNLNAVPLPVNLFSHSDQQTEWQNAVPQGGPNAATGWEGRLADKIVQLNANPAIPPSIGITGNTLQLVGQTTQPSSIGTKNFAPLTGLNDPRTAALTQMLNLPSGVALVQASQNSLNGALAVASAVDSAIKSSTPLTTAFPNTDIGQQLAQVAQIIQIRTALGVSRQIFFCGVGGYDTHSDQLNTQVQLLGNLSGALVAFDTAMGALGLSDNVTTFTESDFSRTFQPNGTGGTDHAWGAHALVLGGAVKGGNLYGTFPTLALQGPDDSGDRGNWVPTTSADQYGAALAKWFGVTAQADLDYVFPNLKSFGYQTPAFI